jgi:MOSC domain-containing protein YiiM
MAATLVQLSTSPGGMPKLSVPSARVTVAGVEGDWQRNRKYHGGPGRAICLYSSELYDWLKEQGFILEWGSLGENFTTAGIDLYELAPTQQLEIGQCVIEITAVREPCRSLSKWDSRLKKVIEGRSGWVAKVIREGRVAQGDAIRLCSIA